MNILVTGAMGHIGHSFCLYAKEKGHNVVTTINKKVDHNKLKILKSKKNAFKLMSGMANALHRQSVCHSTW